MDDVRRGAVDGLEPLRQGLNAVATRVVDDALNAPTARERTQAARLAFDVLGCLSGASTTRVTLQARGASHVLTDMLTLDEVDLRVTGLDPNETHDVHGLVRKLGFVSHRENRQTLDNPDREDGLGSA